MKNSHRQKEFNWHPKLEPITLLLSSVLTPPPPLLTRQSSSVKMMMKYKAEEQKNSCMVDHTEKCPLSISGLSNSYEDPQHTILSQIWRRFQKNYRKWRPKPSWVKTFLIFDLPGIGRHFQLHPPKEQVILHLLYQGERLKSCCTEVIEVSWYPPGGTSISPRGDDDFPPGGLRKIPIWD